ncbi:hypothetical protein GCM10029964_078610 [Kibdelosporangium lantanae]
MSVLRDQLAELAGPDQRPVDFAEAEEFIRLYDHEARPGVPVADRLRAVRAEIDATGGYTHTPEELRFGARVAWRNSARCIGRLYWKSLHVRDRRGVEAPAKVAEECVEHLRFATRGGAIRSTITVFAPDLPGLPGPRIHNEQLVRYAGHTMPDGTVLGDPRSAELTRYAVSNGWRPPNPPSRFDVLPLVVSDASGRPRSGTSRATPCSKSPSGTRSTTGSPSWACGGTRCRRSATCRWWSAASGTRQRPSTAGT